MKLVLFVKTVVLFSAMSLSLVAGAVSAPSSEKVPYYGDAFYTKLGSGIANADLIFEIKRVLRSYHLSTNNAADQIVTSCDGKKNCYSHTSVGYTQARVFLMGNFYLTQVNGHYGIHDVYCQRDYMDTEFSGRKPGPNQIPDEKLINAEHTWPQSRFNPSMQKDFQKSDMHHLFPSDSRLNSIRGNYEFGEVTNDQIQFACKTTARFGRSGKGGLVFEPPVEHRGNVARALFYFSLRYDMKISENEEAAIRKWNKEDPVDAEELDRNEQISHLQGNRNPFVDFPDLADRIENF